MNFFLVIVIVLLAATQIVGAVGLAYMLFFFPAPLDKWEVNIWGVEANGTSAALFCALLFTVGGLRSLGKALTVTDGRQAIVRQPASSLPPQVQRSGFAVAGEDYPSFASGMPNNAADDREVMLRHLEKRFGPFSEQRRERLRHAPPEVWVYEVSALISAHISSSRTLREAESEYEPPGLEEKPNEYYISSSEDEANGIFEEVIGSNYRSM